MTDVLEKNTRTSGAPREDLAHYVVRLIAENEHVSPEHVTLEYIREKRDQEIYPHIHYAQTSQMGGYLMHDSLKTMSRRELEKMVQDSLEKLEHV